MNDDGIVGEFGVDDCVCDDVGGIVVDKFYMEDVDDDGVFEEQIFVDMVFGEDSFNCGCLNFFCRSFVYVYVEKVDGLSDGNEDIVCFIGDDFGDFEIILVGFFDIKMCFCNIVISNEVCMF